MKPQVALSGDHTMIWIANILVALVALLHVYFLVLEMFLWTRPLGLRTFRLSLEKATDSAVLAANQGLYNGFLAAGLFWGLVHPAPAVAFQIKLFFLSCVIVAGAYGAATVSRRILLVQAAPAALALIALWLA
jgi:putative membrane protein